MKTLRVLFACAVLLAAAPVMPASAQYMYLDTDGDGVHTGADQLNGGAEVAIWLDTAHNRDGSPVTCAATGAALDFYSYVFCLRAEGGTVSFGTYSLDLGPTFTVPFGEVKSDTEYKNGFGSATYAPAGLWRLGTLPVSVVSGTPTLAIVAEVANSSDVTSFGTHCAGHDFDNTYKLDACGAGDWTDVDGLGPAPVVACEGYITGVVVGNCPPGGPLSGATVEARTPGTGALNGSAVTGTGGSYTLGPLTVGTYVVVVVTPDGYYPSPNHAANVVGGETASADFSLECMPTEGYIAGQVIADCAVGGGPLAGVTIDAYAYVDGTGTLAATTASDASGNYIIGPVAAGSYVVVPVTPLGYSATPTQHTVDVAGGETVSANFSMLCLPIACKTRQASAWAHDVHCLRTGCSASLSASALCALLNSIVVHFNSSAINPVVLYTPPPDASCSQKLDAAWALLDPTNSGDLAKARRQLMTLLLNVAAGNVSLAQVVCQDGAGNPATVSQVITYCDGVLDDPSSTDAEFKSVWQKLAGDVNACNRVPVDLCPTAETYIAYRAGAGSVSFRVMPNPAPGARTFQFTLRKAGPVRLGVYDVSGRLVVELMHGKAAAGPHAVTWSGASGAGGRVGSGLYFVRLETPDRTHTLKVLLLKP